MSTLLKISVGIGVLLLAICSIPLAILLLPGPFSPYTKVVREDVANVPPPVLPESCQTADVPNEPPCNPNLAQSAWSVSHRGSYAQGSSALPGPDSSDSFLAQHLDLGGVPITLAFTTPYADGGIAAWASPVGVSGTIIKIDHASFGLIDRYKPAEREADFEAGSIGISGAYSLVDRENQFIVGRQRTIDIYGDSVPGDRLSPIVLRHRLVLPDSFFCGDDDLLVGLNLTYDDHLAFVSEQGSVGVVPRDSERLTAENIQTLSLNDCQNQPEDIVSNNISLDETGGIYIVTGREMVRVRWDGSDLDIAWRAPYEGGDGGLSSLRLGPGSGSTPSLMGTAPDDDKFVVITDGQDLMHLVLFWRDEIPPDWQPLAPDIDRRIACQVPVRFGDPEATQTLSEQSVLVRGYATVHVNNLLTSEPRSWRLLPATLRTTLAAGGGGNPDRFPKGIERIDWNPATRRCEMIWANTTLSIPNGIPTMSEETGLFYGIGQRDGGWGLEAVDFETGESRFFVESRQQRCSLEALQQLEPRTLRVFAALSVARNPRACENAFFAATEIGPDASIYTGTLLGATKFSVANELTD